MRRSLRPAVAAGALGAGLAVALFLAQSTTHAAGPHSTPASTAATGTITEFALQIANRFPEAIVAGPDGNLWFTEFHASAIGRITPSGTVNEFSTTTANSQPFWITVGPDGNLWFTEATANKIGKISPASTMLVEFTVPTVNSGPSNIVAGPDGNLWFTEFDGDAIGKISTTGVLTEVAHLAAGAGPTGMVAGSDGNLWFTEQKANKIGRITTAGTVTEFVLAAGRTPAEIAAGPDGNLWFTEFDGNRIGKITTAGSVTEFAVPTPSSQPGSIAEAIDGNLWFTEQNGNKIGRITSDGTITEFGPIPTTGSGPGGINPGPDGNLWFTERLGNKIGQLTLGCDIWIGGSGNFNTASNWSTGAVPNTATDVCITATTRTTPSAAADTYTVVVDSNVSVGTLALGGVSGAQTVQVAGNNSRFLISTTGAINGNGVLLLGDNNVANGWSWLGSGNGSSALTNSGLIKTVQGGGGVRYPRINITNAAGGTVDIAAADTRQDASTTTTNNGSFTVEAGASFAISGNANYFTNSGGTVTNNGTFSEAGNTFIQRGGTETGNPVFLQGAILDDDLTGGSAKFLLSGGDITGTGAQPGVAAGQVVTIAGDNTRVLLDKSLTNAGTINLGDGGTGYSWLGMGTNNIVLTNTGHINTVPGGGGTRLLRFNITNAASGIVDLAAPDSRQDFSAASTINNGVFIVEPGTTFSLSTGSTFTQGAGGTFQTTIDANATKFGQLNGGGDSVSLDGTLKVTTVGKPAAGSSWPIIATANRSGTMFANHDFGYWNYDLQYPATGVTLVAQATCDVWIGGDGNFGTAANWSLGTVPTSTDDACINATTTTIVHATSDTYTVLVNGDFPVRSLTLGGPNGTQTLAIPSGSRLTLLGNSSMNARGVMVLGDAGNGDAWLGCVPACSPTGPTLTNSGTLKTIQGGGGIRHIQVIVINAVGATLDFAGTAVQTAGCNNPGGISKNQGTINNGTVIVEGAGSFKPDCGFVNNAGATVVNNGTLTPGGAWVQRGTESGNPVLFMNGSGIDDDMSAGPGSFVYSGSAGYPSGQVSLTGTGPHPGIPAGQTITIASTNTYIGIFPNMPNAGTIILGDNSGTGDSALCCAYFTSGATITNTGTIKTVQGSGGIRHLQVNVANSPGGIIDIGADTRQDQACGTGGVNATTITNDGTFTIDATGHYAMGNCPSGGYQNTFTQGADGTFQTTVDANATKFGQLTGGTVNLDGKLRVATVGWPSLNSTWPIVSGATRFGTFANFDICGPDYDVEYAPTSVTLAVRATFYTTQTTAQKWLTNSDGTTWSDMDPAQLSLTFTPSADSYAILSGNADLWTSVAGYNQDLGISVSGGGIYPTLTGQPEAWKESGGFAGTFSPNAAFVQTVVSLKQGQQYTVKLVWKANKKALGATIWAGAGPIGTQYSPTRLTARLLPASTSNLKSATITNQAAQSGSDGATWKDLDPGLSFQYTPCVNGMAVLSGNVDLWTSVRGYNQDVGISVSGGAAYPTKAGQPEAWKESGGFAGTFSPNAAFVQTVMPLKANTTYTIKLSWKANKQSPASAAIWAGAGPIGSQYSPSRLLLQFVPSTGGSPSVLDAPSTTQYSQSGSDGSTWKDIDLTSTTPLALQVKSATSCTAIVSANADLWTDTGGFNQDIGITVSGGSYPTVPLQPEAWKESGGSAGTYSPNAAFVQVVLPLLANTQYTVSLQWKSNLPMSNTARIWTGAGPIGSDYSPTRLTVQLLGCT